MSIHQTEVFTLPHIFFPVHVDYADWGVANMAQIPAQQVLGVQALAQILRTALKIVPTEIHLHGLGLKSSLHGLLYLELGA